MSANYKVSILVEKQSIRYFILKNVIYNNKTKILLTITIGKITIFKLDILKLISLLKGSFDIHLRLRQK